jgi:hypothetical protein
VLHRLNSAATLIQRTTTEFPKNGVFGNYDSLQSELADNRTLQEVRRRSPQKCVLPINTHASLITYRLPR